MVDVNATAIGVFVVAVVVLSAAVLSFRWSWATWLQLAASASAIALTLGVRGSVVSDAVKVNEYIAVEGGVGGIDSRITRIAPGNITNVDPDIINVSWAIGAGLFLVIALISSGTVSLRRRRSSSGPDVTIVPV